MYIKYGRKTLLPGFGVPGYQRFCSRFEKKAFILFFWFSPPSIYQLSPGVQLTCIKQVKSELLHTVYFTFIFASLHA